MVTVHSQPDQSNSTLFAPVKDLDGQTTTTMMMMEERRRGKGFGGLRTHVFSQEVVMGVRGGKESVVVGEDGEMSEKETGETGERASDFCVVQECGVEPGVWASPGVSLAEHRHHFSTRSKSAGRG